MIFYNFSVVYIKNFIIFAKLKIKNMTFDKILENNTLWAVRYDGDSDNSLSMIFNQWNDINWLWEFFTKNIKDLESYFKITDLNQAIYDTITDSDDC